MPQSTSFDGPEFEDQQNEWRQISRDLVADAKSIREENVKVMADWEGPDAEALRSNLEEWMKTLEHMVPMKGNGSVDQYGARINQILVAHNKSKVPVLAHYKQMNKGSHYDGFKVQVQEKLDTPMERLKQLAKEMQMA